MHPEDILLSRYGKRSSRGAPVNEMMASFADDFRDGCDINLGVGYVNESTIPQDVIREALTYVLAYPEKYRQALNYGGPAGSRNLVESIRTFLHMPIGGGLPDEILDKNAIVIGASGATSILEGIAEVLEPGIVVTSDPMYYIYCDFLERKGFEVLAVPEDSEGMDTGALRTTLASLAGRRAAVRFLYLVTINNPSCTILSNRRRAEIVETAHTLSHELGRRIPVVFDKAYELLVHDASVGPLDSGLINDELGIVYEIGTLSKLFAPALRIGYLIGRPGAFMDALVQRTSDVGFSASLITQEIASYLIDHCAAEQQAQVNRGYRAKAQRVEAAIEKHLGPHLSEYTGGRAGFYFYLTFQSIRTEEDSMFFRHLACTTGDTAIDGLPGKLRARVVYLPGRICVHPCGTLKDKGLRQLRISYGFEQADRIEEALKYMREAAAFAASVG